MELDELPEPPELPELPVSPELPGLLVPLVGLRVVIGRLSVELLESLSFSHRGAMEVVLLNEITTFKIRFVLRDK